MSNFLPVISTSKLHPTNVSSHSFVSEELGVNQKGVNKKGSLITNNLLALYKALSQRKLTENKIVQIKKRCKLTMGLTRKWLKTGVKQGLGVQRYYHRTARPQVANGEQN
jgi:hypothetical protein